MQEVASTAAAASAAAAAGAAMSGLPPSEVITWAVIGGLVSVWLDRKAEVVLTPRWVAGALMQIAVSAAAGIVFSVMLLSIAGEGWFGFLAPFLKVPQWVLAGSIAALCHKAGPLVFGFFRQKAGVIPTDQGGPHAG